jgi:hypothetical protein
MLSISHTVPSNSINLQELRFQEHNLMISAIVGRQLLAFKETSRVRVSLSKSTIANLILTMIVLRGIVGQWNRRKYKPSEIQLDAIEKALLPPRVPPDPDPLRRNKQKENRDKAKKLRQLAALLTAMGTIPVPISIEQRNLRANLQGYMANNKLRTNELPPTLLQRVRECLIDQSAIDQRGLIGGIGIGIGEAIIDSGASSIGTPHLEDFIAETYQSLAVPETMGGIAGSLDIVGKGMIRYETLDSEGRIQVIKRAAKHIPGLPIRLIPPQVIFHDSSVGYCYISGGKLELRFANGKTIRVDIDPVTNLPILKVFADAAKTATTLESSYYSCVTNETNQNISAAGKDLL